MIIDLKMPEHAYFYGFALTDGNLYESSKNRGRLTIEISSQDCDLLKSFTKIFNVKSSYSERLRKTNFSNNNLISFSKFDIYPNWKNPHINICIILLGDFCYNEAMDI